MEKHQYMRSFISAATEYIKHPTEASASVLQRSIGVIAASSELNIFDPGSSIAVEFYVSLHELMTTLGFRNPLIWSALEVLQNAYRNVAARQALIHTYKFAPILTRLLETNLTPEKRVKVLKLLQELTYGIKLSWQEAHLPYLISTLTQWVMQSKDQEVITFSLGILVNLCYKNLPAVYTLMRTIETKVFLRSLLKIQNKNVNTRVQCCKMMMILENGRENLSERQIVEFVTATFTTLVTALKNRDVLFLRHTVDFFNDIGETAHSKNVLLNYPRYTQDLEDIFATLDNNSDPECVSLVMEFLLSLANQKIPPLVAFYPMCVKVAMTWIPVEQVCSKALALLRTLVIDSRAAKDSSEVFAELDLSVLVLVANCDNEECNESDEETKGKKEKRSTETLIRLTELMQLLQEIARIPAMGNKVMQAFSQQSMRRLLRTLLQHEDSSATNDWPGNLFNDPATTFYVQAIALTAFLAPHDSAWLTLYTELLQNKQVHMIMALALYTGDSEVKQKILQLISTVGFPEKCVPMIARCMNELEPLVLIQNSPGTINTAGKYQSQNQGTEMAPLFSFNQESRLDAFLAKLEEAFDKNQIGDITTSAVMELYDYKLAAMRHAERATQASIEAANNHATSLQHRLAQVVAESSKLHQLLFHNQQSLEGLRAEKSALSATIQAQTVQIQEISKLKKIVAEKNATIDKTNLINADLKKELEARSLKIDEFTKRINELEKLSTKLQDTVVNLKDQKMKKDLIIAEREREITQNHEGMSALKQEIEQLGVQCRKYETIIAEKEENIQKMESELKDLSRMRDMIYQLTASKKVEDTNTTT